MEEEALEEDDYGDDFDEAVEDNDYLAGQAAEKERKVEMVERAVKLVEEKEYSLRRPQIAHAEVSSKQ